MFTIYTFGDPELLREALLALATVFGLSEWWDATSGFGAGGNLLAAALIGLLAVAIAAITSQQIRLDYLLVALILFGVAFGSKTNVQVEDIQSGTSFVVADVPIGIAVVASAASSAARSLTETMSVALQRPGTTTSLLTEAGFLDPLRTLLALRSASFQDLDPTLTRSLLEYYKNCIGHTMQWVPGTFDQALFTRSGDPIGYMLNPANVHNWSTVYYSAANPGGQNMTCHDAAGSIGTDIEDLTADGSLEALGKLRLSMGTKTFDGAFEFADLDDAAEVTTRGIYSGQQFMANALMRNFHNLGEAWRLAEYGTNQAKYAIEVTGALEQQRGAAATQGTVFLNMMFPLMTFFQFVFIALAPFIALLVVASPFTSAKTLGGYALFGVWSYSWMPVAAVINHYIQINVGNLFEYSDVATAGFSYLSIVGMDDFYNQLASQIVIGSNALAAAPAIVGAVLFMSFQGLTSLGGKFAQAQAPTKVSSTVSSPTQTVTNPYAAAGGVVSYETGTRPAWGGMVTEREMGLSILSGNLVGSQTAAMGRAAAERRVDSARNALTASKQRQRAIIEEASRSGTVSGRSVAGIETKTAEAAVSALSGAVNRRDLERMNYDQITELGNRMGVGLGRVFGVSRSNQNRSGNSDGFERAMDYFSRNEANIRAEMSETLAEQYANDRQVSGAFRETGSELKSGMEAVERAESMQAEVSRQAQAVQQIGLSVAGGSAADVFRTLLFSNDAGGLMNRVDSTLAGEFGGDYSAFEDDVRDQYRRTGRSMSGFKNDALGRLVATNLALNNAAQQDPKAMRALHGFYQTLGIGGVGETPEESTINIGGVEGQFDRFGDQLQAVGAGAGGAIDTSTAAGANYEAADGMAVLPEGARDGAGRRQQGNVEANEGLNVGDVNPEFGRRFESGVSRIDGAFDNDSQAGRGPTDVVQDFMLPRAGFTASLGSLGEALTPGLSSDVRGQRIDAALGGLQAEVMKAGGKRKMVDQLYDGFRDAGLSETQAAVATFAAVGPRKEGAEGLLVSAVMGGVVGSGYANADRIGRTFGRTEAGAKSISRFLRGAGPKGAALAIGIGAATSYVQNERNFQAGVGAVREAIKEEFAIANPGEAARIEAFNRRLDQAKTGEEMVAVMQAPDFELSEEQLSLIDEKAASRGAAERFKRNSLSGL